MINLLRMDSTERIQYKWQLLLSVLDYNIHKLVTCKISA